MPRTSLGKVVGLPTPILKPKLSILAGGTSSMLGPRLAHFPFDLNTDPTFPSCLSEPTSRDHFAHLGEKGERSSPA